MTSPRCVRACSCPRTAPAGAPSTPCPPASPACSSPTRWARASTCDLAPVGGRCRRPRDDEPMAATPETYLHGHHDSVLRSHRWRTAENSAGYLLPWLTDTAQVLDIGCGPGTITAGLAARVPGGTVVAIDAAADVVALARQEAARRGPANVRGEGGGAGQP